MSTMKLALLGFGNVGRGLARLLLEKRGALRAKYGFEFAVVGVYDINMGGVITPGGEIDLAHLLEIVEDGGLIADYPGASEDLNSLGLIEMSGADVLVEMTYTDLETGEPAVSHCQQALSGGKHVVTSNKGPAALARKDLWQMAHEHHVHFRCEGAVMSGTPVISLVTSSMAGVEILGFRGILNGTTNYILSRMEEGASYNEALREAQSLGYAEANPTNDVDGWDSAAKGVILTNTLMDADLVLGEVPRQGIGRLTREEIEAARAEGSRWRLIVDCHREGEVVKLAVSPQKINASDPLFAVVGTMNALTFQTDLVGDVTIIGRGAGRTETGFAILSDLLWIHRRQTGHSY